MNATAPKQRRHVGVHGICVVMVLLQLSTGARAAQSSNASLERRFLNEAPQGWGEFRQAAAYLQGDYTYETESSTPEVHARMQVEYRRNADCQLLVEQSLLGNNPKGYLCAINPRYEFQLERNASGEPWVLVHVRLLGDGEPSPSIMEKLRRGTQPLRIGVALGDEELLNVTQKPNFRVRQVATTRRANDELVEVSFSYEHPVPSDPRTEYNPVQGGTMVLDPLRFWGVRSAQLELKSLAGHGKRTLLLDWDESHYPALKRVHASEEWTLNNGQRFRLSGTTNYSLRIPKELPALEDFTLTAFGLPEPPGVEWRRATPWWLWGSLAGTVLLLLGALAHWYHRRFAAS